MAQPLVIQGSWEDLASHAAELRDRDDLVLIVPSRVPDHLGVETPINLAEEMKDYIGSVDLGDANLSVDTGTKYAKLLVDKYQKDRR